jgi:TP901 family phage tail tape measure protein
MAVQINVAANQAALTASIQAGVQAYNQRFAQNNQLNLTVNQRAFSQPLGRMTGDVKDFEAALAASNARVIAFGASTAVLGGVIRSFKELASVTIDVEKNLADINRVFGLSTSQLQKFSSELFNVGKQTASTFDDASKAALEFSRQGLKAEDVLTRTKDALTLTRLAGIGTANAVDALTSTVNGFAATGITTTQILNKLVAVEQDYAVGAGDLAEALSRTGQAAQEAGVSLDQLNALVTAAQQSTARGGAVIGNALKTIFTRLQRTETLDQLEAFNIAVRDVQGNTLPAVTVLQNFAGAYKNLGDAQRAQLSEQVAGVYQVNILKAIVGDLNKSQGIYAGALQRGASATNEAEVATAKLNQTLDALLKQTATSTQQLANNIGKVTFEPLAKYGTEQLKSFVESMNEVLEGEGVGSTFANGLLKGIRNVIAGPGAIAAFFTLFKLIQNSFTYLAQALPQIAGITTETQNRKNIEQSILQIMQQQGPVSQALAGTMGNQAAQAQLLLQVARQQTAEYQMQTTLAKQLAVQLAGQGVRVKGSGGLQVTRAGGYIPAATRMAEVVGAQAGGYAPGRVVSSPVGGVMNTAEDVKYIPGFAQPFINPPAGSKAGRAHRQNSISRTGVDPYMNSGFIPNFAYKNFGFKNNELNLKNQSIRDFSDPAYFEKTNLADGGLGINGKPNNVYDSVSGVIQRIPFVNKKQLNSLAKKYFSAYLKDESIPLVVKDSYDRAFDKLKKSGFYADLGEKKTKAQMLEKFKEKNNGDFYNFRGALYESMVAKKVGSEYKLSSSEHSRSDLLPVNPEIADLFTGIEAKSGATGGNFKILQKAIETAIKGKQLNQDKSEDIPIGKYGVYQTYNDGFIPNFATGLSPKVTRLPWLKSFANKEWFDRFPWFNDIELKNTSQNMDYNPYTGEKKLIPGSEMFRELNFLTHGNNKNLKTGNSSLFSYLYEEYIRKILNSVTQGGSVLDSEEAGFPVRDKFGNPTKFDPFKAANTAPMDALIRNRAGRIGGIEIKGGTEENWKTKDILKKEQDFEAQNPGSTLGRRTRVYSNMYKGTDFLNKGLLKRVGVDKAKSITNNLISFYASKIAGHESEIASNWKANKGLSGGFVPNFAKELEATAGYGSSIYGELNRNKLSIESMDRGNYPIKDPASKKRSVSNILYSGIIEKAKKIIGKDKDLFITGELLPQDRGLAFPQGLSRVKLAKTAIGNLVDPKGASKKLNKEQLLNLLIDPKQQQYLRDSLLELTTTHSKGFIPNFANFIDVDTLGKNSVHYSGDLMKLIKDIESSIGRNLSSGELRFLTNPKTNLSKLNDPKVLNRFINSERKGGFAQFAKGFLPNFAYKQAVMGLEESMSGNKAIFDTKPFPHIRNSSQPTFSSAIADHGGLGNALSDSMRGQKAAGLMSKGFVPNFAKQPNNTSFDIVRFSNSISTSVDNFGKQLSNKIGFVKDSMLLALENMHRNFDPQKIERSAESTAKKIISSISGVGNEFVDTISSSGIDAINNVRNKFTRQNASQSNGGASSQRLTAAQMAASFGNLPTRNEGLEKFTQGLSKASTAISIAGPMLAGFAEQAIYGDKKRTEMTSGERMGQSALSTGLSSLSTGAGIGASFGLPGVIIGGAIGGLVGLTSALNAATLSAEELGQLNQEQTQKSQASISAASSYIEAQKSLAQMIASGASSSDIEIATKKLSDNFNEIKDVKLQEIFNSTGGDVIAMTKQLQDYTNQVTKESARQTGLYGANLKPEERASALSLGLGQEKTSEFIRNAKLALKQANEELSKNPNMLSFSPLSFLSKYGKEKVKTPILKNFAESQIPQNEPERESKVKSLIENILNGNFEEVIKILEKTNIVSEANKAAVNFKQAATRSFNQIFLDMEQQIAKSAFDVALNFEKDSGSRRIQSAILDFSTNFQDSINSFLSNNLPDARKFDFTAATAGQKAEMLLQKSQQDYNKAIAEQDNERSIFLNKSSENLTKEFKSSFLPSQAAAEFYQKNVLPQIQQGNFSGNAESLSEQFKIASFQKAESKFSEAGMAGGLNKNDIASELNRATKVMEALADAGLTNEDQYKQLQEAQKALIDLQNQTALFQNKNEMTKLQGVIDTAAREREIFETKQANAKKELEINKQLSEAKIAVDKDIAIEKAKVDKQILMRMESMKDLSANIGNALEISKARSAANVNALQRRLDDQREIFGMGRSQISERKFGIQADILKEQRRVEDAAINAEIQQRVLEMAAEQENTAATLKLNETIMDLVEIQLRGQLGGQTNIDEIERLLSFGDVSKSDIESKFGKNALSQYQALQRIQESRVDSAANNIGYNTSNFSSKMEAANFNKMDQAEQLKFLEQEETKAREAGNVVLAGTIKRYKDQIVAKKEALTITRDDIDAQIRLATEIEKVNNTFAGRFKKGWGNLKQEGDDLLLNLGENLPKMFADGLVDGIKAAIRESNNLGEALMGIASKFLDSISTTLMQSAIYGILGSIGVPNLPVATKQRGGVIRAQSGMYISGTGSGDKYPALLENGEYVLNRNAVMAMGGPSELDKLNFSMAPRFASGGSFVTELNDLNSMEEGMTTYGLENSKLYNELRDAERAKQAEKRRKAFERKKMIAGIVGSVAGIAASFGIAKAAGSFGSSLKKDFGDVTMNVTPEQLAQNANLAQKGGHIGTRLSDTIPAYAEGGLYSSPIIKKYGVGMQNGGMYGGSSNNSNTVSNTNATNSFNFNTTVNRDGTIQMGADSTSYKQQDVELSNNLNSQVYKTVLDVIKQQQRFGGTLAGTRRPI